MNTSFSKLILATILVAEAALNADAQSGGPFTLHWSTIDGGGGTSAGGQFTLVGTIGQPDVGRMSGGQFAISGGFWSVVDVIQTPGAPLLSIERLANGAVRVFWTLPATGLVLDEVSAITSSPVTGWTQVPAANYQTNATHISITIATPTGSRFYRLRSL